MLADSFADDAVGGLAQQLLLRLLEPVTEYRTLPFDWFCSSMKSAEWARHVCSLCVSIVRAKPH